MQENIRISEQALNVAGRPDGFRASPERQQALAIVGVGQGIVALAKALGTIGAVMYLRHVEEVRGGEPGNDEGIAKLEELARKGLGL